MDPFFDFLSTVELPINLTDLIHILASSNSQCLFIKNQNSIYEFANQNFIQLMGLRHLNELKKSNDLELSKNKRLAIQYRADDEYVLEEEQVLTVKEIIEPKYNSALTKEMKGKLYPIHSKNGKTTHILGLVEPQSKLINLDWDHAFKLTIKELDSLLVKPSYPIVLENNHVVKLSRMQIKTLIQLMKGMHAGEIAETLGLKQSTVEFYLVNIKDRLGLQTRSELINKIISANVLQQIIL